MTEPDTDPSLRDLELAAARTSDAAAALLSSLGSLGHSIRAAHAAGHPVTGIGGITRALGLGRAHARHRRTQNQIRPSTRLAAHAAEVMAAAAACGLHHVRVFDSCVRGEANLGSDVELLVTISDQTRLIDLTRFAIAVETLLTLDEGRVDVLTDDVLRPDSSSGARIVAECQPLAAWAACWVRLDSLPGWVATRDAGASDEELAGAAECGLHQWGETYAALRHRPEGRPAGATLVDPGEVVWVAAVLDRYAAARTGGLGHDEALPRAVTGD